MKKTVKLSLLSKPFDCMLYAFIGPFSILYIIPQFLVGFHAEPTVYGFGSEAIAIVGRVFMFSGAVIAIWCGVIFKVIGKATPFVTSPPALMLRKGIYGYSRNPMMLAILLTLFGEALHFGSVFLVVWFFAWIRAGHLIVVQYEEPQLERRFGEEYLNYCKVVPRWLPFLK